MKPPPDQPSSKRRALTAKERRFVEEYLKDWNAAGAARRAGYSERSARYIGYENLTKPHISDEIARRSRELGAEVDLKPRDVVEAMRQQLPPYRDIRRLWHADGTHKRFDELSADEASWIAGYEVIIKNAQAGDGHTDTVLKVKLMDPMPYVQMAARLHGQDVQRIQVSGDLFARLDEGRQRVADAAKARDRETRGQQPAAE